MLVPRMRVSQLYLVCALLVAGAVLPGPAYAADNPLDAVVRLTAEIPSDARTAQGLGTFREGNGVVIDDGGIVLTIGYLILEAMSVNVHDAAGRPVPADIVAYDYDTGFGLVRATRPLGVKPVHLGDSSDLKQSQPVLITDYRGAAGAVGAHVVSRREFAGFWEYLLDDAIFTSPPHPNWAGSALISQDGRLQGVGSLFVYDAAGGDEVVLGNMFVPIDLLKPILGDLLLDGRSQAPDKPWLGLFTMERNGQLLVTRVSPEGPAERAGIEVGDYVIAVKGERVTTMPELYRHIWALGESGVEVPLSVLKGDAAQDIVVISGDQYDYLRLQRSY